MRWWPTSLRARLTLWFTVVLGVPLVAFAIVSYVVFDRTLLARTDHFVEDALSAFARELANERRMAPSNEAAARTTVHEVRFSQLQIAIADSLGNALAASETDDDAAARAAGFPTFDTGRALAAARGVREGAPQYLTLAGPGGAWRVHARIVTVAGEPLLLAGIAPLRDIEEVLARIRRAFLVAIPVAAGGGRGGGILHGAPLAVARGGDGRARRRHHRCQPPRAPPPS